MPHICASGLTVCLVRRNIYNGYGGCILDAVRERHTDLVDPGAGRGVEDRTGQADRRGAVRIVDDLAVRWGSQREDGYRVWAEVPLAPAS